MTKSENLNVSLKDITEDGVKSILRTRKQLGGYSGEDPPLPIPNREVKLTGADGTATPCGRVGRRRLHARPCQATDRVFLHEVAYDTRRLCPLRPLRRKAPAT